MVLRRAEPVHAPCVEVAVNIYRLMLAGWLYTCLSHGRTESNNTMTGPRVAHTAGGKTDLGKQGKRLLLTSVCFLPHCHSSTTMGRESNK